ncbi:MAG: hypothetical protein AB1609_16445, partial [Bacillota bacterium]
MDPTDLKILPAPAREVLAEKRRTEQQDRDYEFSFKATNDSRKGVPYVARLRVTEGRFVREFVELRKTWGKKEVTVSGAHRARLGEIIEIRAGGSWKNACRARYIATPDGDLVEADSIGDSARKVRVVEP